MHLIGALLLAAVIGAMALSYLGRVTGRVADHGTPGAQRVARGGRRAASDGRRRAQQGVAEIWAEVRAADWLERRRNARTARRAVGRATGRGAMATARGLGRAARGTGRGAASAVRRMRAGRQQRDGQPAAPQAGLEPGQQQAQEQQQSVPGLESATSVQQRLQGVWDAHMERDRRQAAAQSQERAPVPMSTNGSASAPGGGADLFTAIQQVTNHAMSGGLRSKQRAFKTLEDAFDYISQQLTAFARQLSEPGQEYPASIWEPLAKAAAHVKAASSAAGESSSGIGALANMNLGEAADSPVHVPHNTQLNAPR